MLFQQGTLKINAIHEQDVQVTVTLMWDNSVVATFKSN